MKAMVLAAGRGARLAPLTDKTPKPLLPVRGQPLILRNLHQLKLAGVTDVVINTHHLADQIETTLGDGSALGLSIYFSREQELLDTGGGIKNSLPLLREPLFWLYNADIFSDFDFATLPKELAEGDVAHLVLVPKPPGRQSGDFTFDNGRITARGGDQVYGGIALIHRDLFQQSPQGAFSLRDLLFRAVAQNKITAQVHYGEWTDIGTPADYRRINGLDE